MGGDLAKRGIEPFGDGGSDGLRGMFAARSGEVVESFFDDGCAVGSEPDVGEQIGDDRGGVGIGEGGEGAGRWAGAVRVNSSDWVMVGVLRV